MTLCPGPDQQSLTNLLLSGLGGAGVYKSGQKMEQNSLNRGGLQLKKSQDQDKTYKSLFDKGMEKLRTNRVLYKYVKRIKNPFRGAEVQLRPEVIKPQLKSRKIPCRKVANSAANRSIGSTTGCTITEKAPTRAFSCLKAPTSTFTFKTLLRHYAKRSLNVKLGPRRNYHKGLVGAFSVIVQPVVEPMDRFAALYKND